MPQNGIKSQGIALLATAFVKNPSLKHLDLNDNTFGREGSAALANAIALLL